MRKLPSLFCGLVLVMASGVTNADNFDATGFGFVWDGRSFQFSG